MMNRLTKCLGLALAACLSCLAFTASAGDYIDHYLVARASFAQAEPQGVAFQRLTLTLAQWREQSQVAASAPLTDMRKSGHGFVFKGVSGPFPDAGEPLAG
ncbi:hypothetical protein PMM47T1_13920 [Pseudomonas sp. M47T1]|uniref:hypothetical protein n=1 Tax=Pseudomonas sp. M47T1 TaxID=1179778 RepID=UPI00026085F3|nr:hypothetical protein [Pseudomonas sp. M47T1]EIK96062.1 hypothetical protein PMM47T1_13920 [Pseudomonas sp. M47T1]